MYDVYYVFLATVNSLISERDCLRETVDEKIELIKKESLSNEEIIKKLEELTLRIDKMNGS